MKRDKKPKKKSRRHLAVLERAVTRGYHVGATGIAGVKEVGTGAIGFWQDVQGGIGEMMSGLGECLNNNARETMRLRMEEFERRMMAQTVPHAVEMMISRANLAMEQMQDEQMIAELNDMMNIAIAEAEAEEALMADVDQALAEQEQDDSDDEQDAEDQADAEAAASSDSDSNGSDGTDGGDFGSEEAAGDSSSGDDSGSGDGDAGGNSGAGDGGDGE